MVAITTRKLQFFIAAFVGASTLVSAQGSHSVDTLAVRGVGLDDQIDLVGRGYDDEALSVREYIDEQIEIALRDYEEEIQELFARHTQAEITSKINYFRSALARSEPLLRPAVRAMQDAKRRSDRAPNDQALKQAYRKAKNNADTQRGIVEQDREQLEYWQRQRPSPSPGRSPSPSKGKK
jgi:hypothetical protein